MTTARPLDRLRARVEALGAPLCAGIDPHPDALPAGLPRDVKGIERFARELIEAVAPHVVAVKLNAAFYEAWGSAGWAALERIRADVPAELVVVFDAKRGDIGPTAERYAEAAFGHLRADAVTLSPYLGADAIEPFLAWDDRLVYVLARTTNPSAGTLQDLPLAEGGEPLHLRVGRWVTERWPHGRAGLVVGSTAADELRALRRALPGPAFLIPGVGAQEGDLVAATRSCHGAWAPGLVSVSRAIAGASIGDDWPQAAGAAAGELRAEMSGAVLHSTVSATGPAGATRGS